MLYFAIWLVCCLYLSGQSIICDEFAYFQGLNLIRFNKLVDYMIMSFWNIDYVLRQFFQICRRLSEFCRLLVNLIPLHICRDPLVSLVHVGKRERWVLDSKDRTEKRYYIYLTLSFIIYYRKTPVIRPWSYIRHKTIGVFVLID